MATPRSIEEKMDRILNAWRTLAPDKTFGGMTVAQFEAAMAPSKAARQQINNLEDQLTAAKANRDESDSNVLFKAQLVVAGVLADPTEGPDSALYAAFGYTRQSERKTGLTRKHTKQPAQ